MLDGSGGFGFNFIFFDFGDINWIWKVFLW
jgi:hypothetical protein